MNKTKHTSAPWECKTPSAIEGEYPVFTDSHSPCHCVAVAFNKEDQQLIAAAPEMLDALEMFVEEWGVRGGDVDVAFSLATRIIKIAKGE